MTTLVKICGITNAGDAHLAASAGCDFLGLVLADNSPRRICINRAQEIIESVKHPLKMVGVFQNQPAEWVNQTATLLSLDYVQLHGVESPEYCRAISAPIIKAFDIHHHFELSEIMPYRPLISAVLLDKPKGLNDPTWLKQALEIAKSYPPEWPPLIFAGGLSPTSVPEVLQKLRPWAVDVCSGVESTPGFKEPHKVRTFCQMARKEIACVPQENSVALAEFMFPKL